MFWTLQGLKLTPVLGGQSGKFPWILSGPSQNEESLDFFQLKMKNLDKCPMAFKGALTKRKEQAHEITVKTARNFHFRTKHSLKWMILESRQRNEEKGSPMKLHIGFYF